MVRTELLRFDGDDGILAVGWILHHSYLGHISVKSQIGGLRLRAGNVQVGGHDLVEEAFPEARFNGWAIGEIHVVDPRVLPNARRDHFEQNIHFSNLTGHLLPVGRSIAKKCRTASVERHREREVRQGALKATVVEPAGADIDADAEAMAQFISKAREVLVSVTAPQAQEALAQLDRIRGRGGAPVTLHKPLMQVGLRERLGQLLAEAGASREEANAAFQQALADHFD